MTPEDAQRFVHYPSLGGSLCGHHVPIERCEVWSFNCPECRAIMDAQLRRSGLGPRAVTLTVELVAQKSREARRLLREATQAEKTGDRKRAQRLRSHAEAVTQEMRRLAASLES